MPKRPDRRLTILAFIQRLQKMAPGSGCSTACKHRARQCIGRDYYRKRESIQYRSGWLPQSLAGDPQRDPDAGGQAPLRMPGNFSLIGLLCSLAN